MSEEKYSEQMVFQLKCLERSSQELALCFERYAKQSSSPLVQDEFQKLSASAANHSSVISDLLGEDN
ncbi:MAG: hypothetical protein LUE12_06675 [Ruminococcus sp.]|nr:hypothetical protein [Ruminococcus sp.]